jgi:hypothetical protein
MYRNRIPFQGVSVIERPTEFHSTTFNLFSKGGVRVPRCGDDHEDFGMTTLVSKLATTGSAWSEAIVLDGVAGRGS